METESISGKIDEDKLTLSQREWLRNFIKDHPVEVGIMDRAETILPVIEKMKKHKKKKRPSVIIEIYM